jgi:O-antigen/teichoic acid export membrane protein
MSENLTSKAFRALNWSYLSAIANAVMQIGFMAALARLLNPDAFGLVAMASFILLFGSYFAQMGISSALIQKDELTTEDIRAGFTSSVLLGVAFSILIYFLAPLSLYVFDKPAIIPVVQVMGISFFLIGLSTTAISLLRRKLDFRSLAFIEITSYMIGYGIVGVILALLNFGVWSLVIANLCQPGLRALLAYVCKPHIIWPFFKWEVHRRLFFFGGRVSIICFFEFIGFNVDTLVIGRVWGAQLLGIYSRSFAIVNLPTQHLAVTFSNVMFPSFSQVQKDIPRLRSAYYSGLMLVAVVVMPLSFGVVPAARELVLVLLGDQWMSGIPILQILALMVPFNMGTVLPAIVCDSLGRLNAKFLLQIAFVGLVIALITLAYTHGLPAIAAVVVVANVLRFVAYQVLMRKLIAISFREILNAHIPGLIASMAVVLGITTIHWLLFDLPPGVLLLMEILIGGLGFVFLVILKPQPVLKEVILRTLTGLKGDTHSNWLSGRVVNWYSTRILSM